MTGEVWAVRFLPKILHAPEQQILLVRLSAARPHPWCWGCSVKECSKTDMARGDHGRVTDDKPEPGIPEQGDI